MRLVNLTDFRALPENTLFCKYSPDIFEEIQTKGETWECDFLSASLIDYDLKRRCNGDDLKIGESIQIEINSYGRDGLFKENQLFAIFEKKDLEVLINHLNVCLKAIP